MTASAVLSRVKQAPLWLKLALLATPVYITWLAQYPKRTPLERVGEIGFLALLQALNAWTLWRASRRSDLPPRYAVAFRWLAASAGSILAACLLFPFTSSVITFQPNLGLVDIFFLLAYPIAFLGLIRFPKAAPPLPGTWRVLLDAAVFIVGVGAPLWVFAVHPALRQSLNLTAILSAAYPCMAFIGFMILNAALLRSEPFPSRPAFYCLLAGLGTSWVADLIFALDLAHSTSVSLGYLVNISNSLAADMCLIGAWLSLTSPAAPQPRRPSAVSPIPVITIVFVILGLWPLLFNSAMDYQGLRRELVGVLALILVLLLRETLALRETSHLAAEAATANLKGRFEALVRHSSDLILVLDQSGELSFASPASRKVLGLEPEAMQGQLLRSFLHTEDLAPAASFLSDLLHSTHTLIHQCRLRHADDSWRLLEISGSNLLDDPTVHGMVLNARDISERHRLEDQLREAQKMEAVGRLAGGVAHDFNNLLSAILGNAELAETSLPEGHPAGRDLRRIHGAATRGAALTGRLLAFCRRDSPESKTIDLRQLIKGVTPLLEGLLGERIRLVFDIERQVWPITIDPNELEQALLNMAANARDAMTDGGRFTIKLQNMQIPEAILTPYLPIAAGDSVVLDVSDSGTGMEESTLSHLFEPFFTTKSRGRGTGLGLASVYGLVKASNGGIDVHTRLGEGTTIRLVFPRSVLAVDEPEVSGANPIRGFETILLVEDDPAVREATQRSLTGNGYVVLAAQDAAEARALFKSHPGDVHLLLTDVIMPGDSGPVLAAELVKANPNLRVLYISGYTADELGPHGLARPDAPLLRKPFTVGQLTRYLRAVLAGAPGRI